MNRYFGLHTLEGEWHALLPRYLLLAERVKGRRILDIGCGSGLGASLLLELGAESVEAVDHRPAVLELARIKHAKQGLDFHVMLYEELEFDDESFDLVLCLDTTSPVTDPNLLREVERVLKDDGEYICAIERRTLVGFETVLPRYGYAEAAESIDIIRATNEKVPQLGELSRHFETIHSLMQRPRLSFLFDRAPASAEALGAQSEEIRRVDEDGAESVLAREEIVVNEAAGLSETVGPERYIDVNKRLCTSDNDDFAGVEMLFCGRGNLPLPPTQEIQLPYYSLAERLKILFSELQIRQGEGLDSDDVFSEVVDDPAEERAEAEAAQAAEEEAAQVSELQRDYEDSFRTGIFRAPFTQEAALEDMPTEIRQRPTPPAGSYEDQTGEYLAPPEAISPASPAAVGSGPRAAAMLRQLGATTQRQELTSQHLDAQIQELDGLQRRIQTSFDRLFFETSRNLQERQRQLNGFAELLHASLQQQSKQHDLQRHVAHLGEENRRLVLQLRERDGYIAQLESRLEERNTGEFDAYTLPDDPPVEENARDDELDDIPASIEEAPVIHSQEEDDLWTTREYEAPTIDAAPPTLEQQQAAISARNRVEEDSFGRQETRAFQRPEQLGATPLRPGAQAPAAEDDEEASGFDNSPTQIYSGDRARQAELLSEIKLPGEDDEQTTAWIEDEAKVAAEPARAPEPADDEAPSEAEGEDAAAELTANEESEESEESEASAAVQDMDEASSDGGLGEESLSEASWLEESLHEDTSDIEDDDGIEDSDAEDSVVEDSDAEDSDVEDSDVEDSDVEDSDVEDSDVEDSASATDEFAAQEAAEVKGDLASSGSDGGVDGERPWAASGNSASAIATLDMPSPEEDGWTSVGAARAAGQGGPRAREEEEADDSEAEAEGLNEDEEQDLDRAPAPGPDGADGSVDEEQGEEP